MNSLDRVNKIKEEVGVIDPENPDEYMTQLFDKTPDFTYTTLEYPDENMRAQKQAEISQHRHRLREAVPRLSEVGRQYADLLRSFSNELQLEPGKIRVYLVGGRVYEKPLVETSDLDLVLTVEHAGQGLQATAADAADFATRKRTLYKTWKEKSLEIDRGFRLTDMVEGRESSFIEPKGLGLQTDEQFRASNTDTRQRKAVLIYSD